MNKKTKLFIALFAMTTIFTGLAASCKPGNNSSTPDSSVDLQNPSDFNFKLNKSTCRLSWDGEDNATYEVSEDGINWIQVDSARVNLLDVVTTTATTKIYVRAYAGDVKGESAEFPITVQALGTPNKATYHYDETTYERGFTWEQVQGANQYQVKVTADGVTGNWINASGTNVHTISETGSYSIQVRCKGFYEGDVLMIPGGASEMSETISVYSAPTLRVPDTNRITWMSSIEFESYKLSITDALGNKTIYDDIVLDGVDINLVEEGYITRTGEYDIQIIGVKDGQLYGSNIWTEFGTLNINDNEIYSFDNRQMNLVFPQSGVTVSNEQYVGKTDDPDTQTFGYSMKIDGTDSSVTGQLNIVKYGDYLDADMPVSDWRDITEITMQVYVPTQTDAEGNEITSFSGDIVSVRFEEYVSTDDYAYTTAGYFTQSFYGDYDATYPTDTWVTITIPCEVPYSNVLVLHHRFAMYGIVGYVDEITYTKAEDRSQSYNAAEYAPEDTQYIATVGRKGVLTGYQDGTRTPINLGTEYAGKNVDLTFYVKGTAVNPDNKAGFVILSEPRFNKEGQWDAPIDANGNGIEGEDYVIAYDSTNGMDGQAHQMTEWLPYVVKNVAIPETGIIWLDPFFRFETGMDGTMEDEVNIYIKNIDISISKTCAVHFETNGGVAMDDAIISVKDSLVDFDTTYAPSKDNAIFEGWYLTETFEAGTRIGTDITSLPTDSTELTVYAKWDEYTAKAQYYWYTGENIGAWFGGQATKILLDGCKAGDEVALTMKVKTSQDGTEGASVRLYHTYRDAEWLDQMDVGGYDDGVALNPATESGWREITITVTLQQDGYVWLGVANEVPSSGQCFVYMKDVSFEVIVNYTVHFEVNGGEAMEDVVLAEGTSLVDFDATYAPSKDNAIFEGWYLSETFEAGTRVGTDITSLPTDSTELTVYAKWDEYTAKAQYYWYTGENIGAWFGGQATKILLDGCKAGDEVALTMKVKTSQDGTEGASVRLYHTYRDTEWLDKTDEGGYWSGVSLSPATESGWREITITVTLKQDGYVWLGVASENPGLGQCFVYMKDVSFEVIVNYTVHFEVNGGEAMEDVVLGEGTSLVDFDTTYAPSKDNAIFEGWYLTETFEAGTRIGTDITSLTGDNKELTVYAKWDEYTAKAQYYWYTGSNLGTYFGGQATKVLLDGCKTGDEVTLTMKVKTSQDGTEGASVKLYHTYRDTEWLDKTDEGGYWSGVSLSPATESGWREITITVTLQQDGYVWLGVASENPGLGQCFVYMKDVSFEVIVNYTVHFEVNGGEAMEDVVLADGTSLVDFDTAYAPTKANAIFEGWYLSETFEAGTRIGTDITALPTDSTELTVYAKWDEYTDKSHYYSNYNSWFGGQAAKVLLDGCKAGDEVTLTMKVKTSLDGTEGASVKLYHSYRDAEWLDQNDNGGYYDGVALNAATESGWREITITVTLQQDGYVWLGVANEVPSSGQCFVYMKDISFEFKAEYTAQYYWYTGSNIGAWFGGQAAKVLLDGCKTGDVVTLTMQVKTSQDGTESANVRLYHSYRDAEWLDQTDEGGFSNGVKLNPATESGWREITITVTLQQDGYVWLGVASEAPALGACKVEMRSVSYEVEYSYKAQYYSSVNSWFGGQATKVALDGYKTGDEVTLTMKAKTSQDGTEGASIKLYQTYADTEWIGSNNQDGYYDGAALNPATESDWREITITVTLKQDGYVWLAVVNENPSLGQCWVYIKDVAVNA